MRVKKRVNKHLLAVGAAALMLLGLAFAASACGAGAGGGVPLAYTYVVGNSWVHELDTVVNSTTQGGGEEPATSEEKTKIRLTTTVTQVANDGTATLTMKYETLESTVDGQAQDLTGQVPQEVTVTVDKTGKVISTTGLDESSAISGLLESSGMFSSADFTSQFLSVIYPAAGTAKVGEEWTSPSSIPLTGLNQELKVTTKAKLTAVATENGRQIATIDYTTAVPMNLDLDLGAMLQAMMEGLGGTDSTSTTEKLVFKMTMKGSVSFTGTTKIDTATGQAVSGSSNGTMTLTAQVTDAPEDLVPADQRGPYTSDATMNLTLTEAK